MKKLVLAIALLGLTSVSFSATRCITSSDGITICSNPDGSWG